MLRWRLAPYWARIIAHKQLVLTAALCGALVAAFISTAFPPTQMAQVAHVVVQLPQESEYWSCYYFPPPTFPVKLAAKLDAAAVRVGLPAPQLAETVAGWEAELRMRKSNTHP